MFTCINCTKQTGQEEEAHPTGQEEEAHTGTPRTRDVRNLTAQVLNPTLIPLAFST